jgi:hypothetical protein
MGRSQGPAKLIPLESAAEILKVNPASVVAWAGRGLLEQVIVKRKAHYRRDQVEGLAPLVADSGPLDLGTIAARADLAYAASSNCEVRVNALLDLLGLNRNTLDLREFAIIALHEEVEASLLEAEPPTIEQLRVLAGTFFAIDEAYLFLVEKYLHTDEPWKKYLDAGYKLAVEAPYEKFVDEPALRVAYGYLSAARAQLRTVSYFYCRDRHGPKLSARVFKDRNDVTERIIGLLYPH